MAKSRIQQRDEMTKVLFWTFLVIFVITAIFAFIGLAINFIAPSYITENPRLDKLTWGLWTGVLLQVAVGIFALWRNLFGLSSEEEFSTMSNKVSEIIDFLESNENLSEDEANALREQYIEDIGTSGTVLKNQKGDKGKG